MSDYGYLRIKNTRDENLEFTVPNSGWNCCDLPLPGDVFAKVRAGETSSYVQVLRKDGHGCDGEQGYFQLSPSFLDAQQFDFDSNGAMQLSGGSGVNYGSQLKADGGAEKQPAYTWSIS